MFFSLKVDEGSELYFPECLGIYFLTSYFDNDFKIFTCFYGWHVKLSMNFSKYPSFRDVGDGSFPRELICRKLFATVLNIYE